MQAYPLISVVIPARMHNVQLILPLLKCLEAQILQDFEVIIVCDRYFEQYEWKILLELLKQRTSLFHKIKLFSHLNASFQPQSPGGASAVRNFGILQSRGEFIQLLDDDNRIDPHYLLRMVSKYQELSAVLQSEVVITPTLMWRDSEQIQNQGFSSYNYRLARPNIYFHYSHQPYAEIQMFSGNGVFAKARLMQETLYDEQIAWIAEDLDFVYRMYQKGAKILNLPDIQLQHREREKNILEQAWIGNARSAQQKIKNIFLRHKKHARWFQFLLFLFWSSWGITVWLSIKALRYGKSQRRSIVLGLRKGYSDGWKVLMHKEN